jgi:hypothetical protein
MYHANIIQYITATQTFHFAKNIFYQSYQLPEGLACKAPTYIFCGYFRTKKTSYLIFWLIQYYGRAKCQVLRNITGI